jgi:hypothetical protein
VLIIGYLVAGSCCIYNNSSMNYIIASIDLTIDIYFEILTKPKGIYTILITVVVIKSTWDLIKSLTVQTVSETGG